MRHAIPVRIRLYVPALKQDARLAHAGAQLLEKQEGVIRVRSNRSSGSLVSEYDPYQSDIPTKLKRAMSVGTTSMLLSLSQTQPGNTEGSHEKVATKDADSLTPGLELNPLALPTASLAFSLLGGPVGTALTLPLLG